MTPKLISGWPEHVEREHEKMREEGIPREWIEAHGTATQMCRAAWALELQQRAVADPDGDRCDLEAAKVERERAEYMQAHRESVAAGRLADELRRATDAELEGYQAAFSEQLTGLCRSLAQIIPAGIRGNDDTQIRAVEKEIRRCRAGLVAVHAESERREG